MEVQRTPIKLHHLYISQTDSFQPSFVAELGSADKILGRLVVDKLDLKWEMKPFAELEKE